MSKVIAVCGVKNSGKTTLINNLVRAYTERGMKVAVIKHDGHDFDCDILGTDTHSFTESGAYGTACFSKDRIFVHKKAGSENAEETAKSLMELFPEADLILVEGLKGSSLKKIEVIRKDISDKPASDPEGRFLIVTDLPGEKFREETAGPDDTGAIIAAIDAV
jgi:molybdopterin-guanine dinucleotide biosynthesis protein B